MFTNKELYHASKIAYYIFDYDFYATIGNLGRMPLSTAFKSYSDDLYDKATKELTPEECAATHGFYDSIKLKENVEPYAYANWTILRVDNYNDENGCYAISLLPPDSDTAIIAFRGSENGSASIFINDWVVADFGLFAGEVTAQQTTAMDIVKNILEDESLKDYNFVLTGHSLGGNLATHCTLNTYSNRILSCTSFDGPNFAQKYYTEHADEVKMNAYKLEHMQWSLVGAIFEEVPGSMNYSIKVRDDIFDDTFGKHNLMDNKCVESVKFDDNGNVIEDKMYTLENIVKGVTIAADGIVDMHILLDVLFTSINNHAELLTDHPILFWGFAISDVVASSAIKPDDIPNCVKILLAVYNELMNDAAYADIFSDCIVKGDDILIGTDDKNNLFKISDDTAEIHTGKGVNTCVIESDTYNTFINAATVGNGTNGTTIIFSDGTTLDNVVITTNEESNDLIITRKDVEGKTITVSGIAVSPGSYDIIFLFADGTRVFTINGADEFKNISGTEADDKLFAAYDDSTIFGHGGCDDITGSDGNDTINGGMGLDTLWGKGGDDAIFGDDNSDTLFGEDGDDTIRGGLGNDEIHGGAGNDHLYGEAEDDSLYSDPANHDIKADTIYGGDGTDYIYGGYGTDKLYGGNDYDYIYGGRGDDEIYGDGDGNTIVGGYGSDTIHGGDGNDTIHCDLESDQGNGGDDIAHGYEGVDTIKGGYGNDTLYGGYDEDSLYGQSGDDKLYGENGHDRLNGGDGDDLLHGGAGEDTLKGGEGDDELTGGDDNDLLIGGEGTNTYRFISMESGNDTVNGSNGDTIIELPQHLTDEDIKAYFYQKTLMIDYGNSTVSISNYFNDVNKRGFYYRYGDGRKYDMSKDSFAYQLYDPKFHVLISELFNYVMEDDPEYSYAKFYHDMVEKIMDAIESGEIDEDILNIDPNLAEEAAKDLKYLVDLLGFLTDPENNPYVNEAFDADAIDNIINNIKNELGYLETVNDNIGGLIGSFNSFVSGGGSTAADSAAGSAEAMRNAYNNFMTAERTAIPDPLIIDISGDGFSFTAADEGVNFDINNDGFAEKTGWTNGDDALLVLDRDGDGSITNGSELFGDQTILADGTLASSGFVALAEFDENSDNRIDSGDSVFADLRIWQDVNHNGISEADELSSLADSGVESISLVSTAVDNTDAESGAYFASIANVVMADGSDCNIGEFKFPSNLYDTVDLVVAEVSEEIAALPNVRSYGSVLSLHKAMALDSDSSLFERVNLFCSETDIATVDTLLEEILFELCDAAEVDPASRGRYIDARKLTVVERMLGSDFAGVNGGNPNSAAAPILIEAYDKIYSTYYNTLTAQSTIETYLRFGQLSIEEDSVSINVDSVCAYLRRNYEKGTDVSRVAADLGRYFRYLDESYGTTYFIDYYCSCANISQELSTIIADGLISPLLGTGEDDVLNGIFEIDVVFGRDGADKISAQHGNDIIFGDGGDDTIYGFVGDDHIIGGGGNDTLKGEIGVDTYYFSKGCGNDSITDINDYSIIRFLDGITPDDLIASSSDGYDVVIGIKDTEDTICLKAFRSNKKYRDFYFEFDNGQKIHCMDANSPIGVIFGDDTDNTISGSLNPSIIFGQDGNDTIRGTAGNDSLFGGNGNDTITGYAGDDLLDGNEGDDTLEGGDGNDIYTFGEGYGTDTVYDYLGSNTIRFGEGISPEDIKMSHNGTYSIKLYTDGIDETLVLKYYTMEEKYRNYTLEFDDGTVLSGDDNYIFRIIHGTDTTDSFSAIHEGSVLYGYAGNDTLSGSASNDIIYGGEGNDNILSRGGDDFIDGGTGDDTLNGSTGHDTYVFGIGYGTDKITDIANDVSTIKFTDGISINDLKMRHHGTYSVAITIDGYDDKLILWNYKESDEYKNYIMEFADGTVVSAEDNPIFKNVHGTDEADSFSSINESSILHGHAGNDSLNGNASSDIIYGGEGNDTIYGRDGDDLIDGSAGNDTLNGNNGHDTYVFGLGYGTDKITDVANDVNTIKFADGINIEDLKMQHYSTYSIKITVDGTDDMLILSNYKKSEEYRNYTMEFADGTVITSEDNTVFKVVHGTDEADSFSAINEGSILYGYAGNDTLNGIASTDTIYGGEGNDTIYGREGDDLIFGNTGDDKLYGNDGNDQFDDCFGNDEITGGNGNDIYIFGKGYGTDTINDNAGENVIRFTDGISVEDLKMSHYSSSSVKIAFDGIDDVLILKNYKDGDEYKNYTMEFADGTVITSEDNTVFKVVHGTDEADSFSAINEGSILYGYAGNDTLNGIASSDTIYGGEGNDTIYGRDGDDLIDGGADNDTLNGNNGHDTYVFGIGYGTDKITEIANDTSTIKFINGITADDLVLTCTSNNLSIAINGSDDILKINQFGKSAEYQSYILEFEDGSTYTIDPSTYTLIPCSDINTETADYFEAAETITEIQTYDTACVSSVSTTCVIYPNVALINDILAVAENDVYNYVSDNNINFTDKSNLLFEQFYVN